MKRKIAGVLAMAAVATMLFSCGDDKPSGPAGMDTSCVGEWIGAMEPIPLAGFNGAKIFAHLESQPQTFELLTRDTTRGTSSAIKDTTLALTGTWSLNAAKDSVLLTCDTGKIIDTALNILKPLSVRGQVIPVYLKIAVNPATSAIEWDIAFSDFLPLAPLLGITIPQGIPPSVWQAIRIILLKTKQ
jgi:hypothetical protein